MTGRQDKQRKISMEQAFYNIQKSEYASSVRDQLLLSQTKIKQYFSKLDADLKNGKLNLGKNETKKQEDSDHEPEILS